MGIPFDFPKPTALIHYLLHLIPENDYTVLDFFSGSATTAHAVMQLNSEDNGKRKFIMIQLPEKCDNTPAGKQPGYETICDIGRKRIEQAGNKIKEDNPLLTDALDTGFRVFSIDSTNMTDVYYSVEEINQQNLMDMISNIKQDRTSADLLFGCLLEWGLPINLPYTTEQIDNYHLHIYNDGDLIACFEEDVPEDIIRAIAKRKPLRAVFRDSSFASSPAKINVFELFKLLAPDCRVKVI